MQFVTLFLVMCLNTNPNSCIEREVRNPQTLYSVNGQNGELTTQLMPLSYFGCRGSDGILAVQQDWQEHPLKGWHIAGWKCLGGNKPKVSEGGA